MCLDFFTNIHTIHYQHFYGCNCLFSRGHCHTHQQNLHSTKVYHKMFQRKYIGTEQKAWGKPGWYLRKAPAILHCLCEDCPHQNRNAGFTTYHKCTKEIILKCLGFHIAIFTKTTFLVNSFVSTDLYNGILMKSSFPRFVGVWQCQEDIINFADMHLVYYYPASSPLWYQYLGSWHVNQWFPPLIRTIVNRTCLKGFFSVLAKWMYSRYSMIPMYHKVPALSTIVFDTVQKCWNTKQYVGYIDPTNF